jgi:hypothetical protein
VVATDELDAEEVLVVVKALEALGAGGGREAGLDVDVAQAPDLELPTPHHAARDERLVLLRLVEAPHQRPHLKPGSRAANRNETKRRIRTNQQNKRHRAGSTTANQPAARTADSRSKMEEKKSATKSHARRELRGPPAAAGANNRKGKKR